MIYSNIDLWLKPGLHYDEYGETASYVKLRIAILNLPPIMQTAEIIRRVCWQIFSMLKIWWRQKNSLWFRSDFVGDRNPHFFDVSMPCEAVSSRYEVVTISLVVVVNDHWRQNNGKWRPISEPDDTLRQVTNL